VGKSRIVTETRKMKKKKGMEKAGTTKGTTRTQTRKPTSNEAVPDPHKTIVGEKTENKETV
jgi:hypothetical protein